MQSPLKRILVFDLETGGLDHKINSITEFAGVVIETETLEIVEEFSVMLLPYMDLRHLTEDHKKDATLIFKSLAVKDEESNVKSLDVNGEKLTLKTLVPLIELLENFQEEYLKFEDPIITTEELLKLETSPHKVIVDILFNYTYHPQALAVTHISKEMLIKEGVSKEEAFNQVQELIKRNTVGNSKPILAGHNINGFDIPFVVKWFVDNGADLIKVINKMVIDTLEWARLRWYELPSFSLGICANAVGLTLKESHRALPDTVANANFLIKLLQNMRGEGSQESTYRRRKYIFNF